MVRPYRSEGTRGRCEWGVGITGGGYTSGCDRSRDPRILPEDVQLGTNISGVELPDCSAVATSLAQEEMLVGGDGDCERGIIVFAVASKIGDGWGTG